MPPRDLVIGLDSSTTACKAVVFDRAGQALAEGRAALPMLKPRPGWHEQPAGEWWSAACTALQAAVQGVDTNRLAGLGITAQRETFALVGETGEPLGHALLWMDERAAPLLDELAQKYAAQGAAQEAAQGGLDPTPQAGFELAHAESGKPLSANVTTAKLYWLYKNQPEIARRADKVCDVHAFLAYRLTGRWVTSWGCADPTGLFNMQTNAWNAPLITTAGFNLSQFPDCEPPGAIVGRVTPEAARATGLPEGLPLVAGLGDGQAAGLGVNANQPGQAYLNLGTAVVSGTAAGEYITNRAFRTHTGGVPGQYLFETVLLGGTYTISWLVEKFGVEGLNTPAAFEAAAAGIAPGADGLTLVPYWNSAMNPYWDPSASGIMVGWRGAHGPGHVYRAILEGIAFEQRLATEGVEAALGQQVERFIAVGGGTKSPVWLQIIADVTGKPVYRSQVTEASALGAAVLAAAATGIYADASTAAGAMSAVEDTPTLPNEERHAFYSRRFETVYRPLYPAVREILKNLAEDGDRPGE